MKTLQPLCILSSVDILSILEAQEALERKLSSILQTMEDGVAEWNSLVDPASSGTQDPDSSRFKDAFFGNLREAFRQVASQIEGLESLLKTNKESLAALKAQTKIERLKTLVINPVAGEFVKYDGSELTTDAATQADPSVRGLLDVDFHGEHSNQFMVVSDQKKLRPTRSVDFGKTSIEGNYREQVRRISLDTYIETPEADDKYVYLEPVSGFEPEITYFSWTGGNQSFTLDSPATLYFHHEIGGFVRTK